MSNAQTTNAQISNARTADAPTGVVRRLDKADLARVVAIDQAIGDRSRYGFFERRVDAAIGDPAGYISLGYVEDGVVQGFVLAHILDGEFGGRHPIAVLDAIGVDKGARGHGGAHALLAELQKAARGRGARAVRTQASWPDEAIMHFLAAAGFQLGTRLVLDRPTVRAPGELRPGEEESEGQDLSQDRIAVRAMTLLDIPAVISIDRSVTGRDRSAYLHRKAEDVLKSRGLRMSMLAEIDGTPAGFVMARVDYGEFGQAEPEAVFDTIGVDPEFAGQNVGSVLLAQLLEQLANLQVERVRTVVEWNNVELIAFLDKLGFRPTQNLTLALPL